MTVSAGCISRLASLYGLVMRISCSTPGISSSGAESTASVFPVMPMAVRCGPGSEMGFELLPLDVFDNAANLPFTGRDGHDDEH